MTTFISLQWRTVLHRKLSPPLSAVSYCNFSHHALPLLPLPLPVCKWLLSWWCQADDALLCDGKPCWRHRAGVCSRGEARPGRLLSLSLLLLPLLLSLSGLHLLLLLLQHLLFLLRQPDPQLLLAPAPHPTVLLHLRPKTDPPARDACLCHHHHPPQVSHRQPTGLQSASCRTAPGQRGTDRVRQSQLATVIKHTGVSQCLSGFFIWLNSLMQILDFIYIYIYIYI